MRKITALLVASLMAATLMACGKSASSDSAAQAEAPAQETAAEEASAEETPAEESQQEAQAQEPEAEKPAEAGQPAEEPAEAGEPAQEPAEPAAEEPAAAAGDHQPVTITLSTTAAETDIQGSCWRELEKYVTQKCPWITFEFDYESAKYDESAALAAVKSGGLAMTVTTPDTLGEYAPGMSIFGACYIFDSPEQIAAVFGESGIGQELSDAVAADTGIRLIGAAYCGSRQLNLTIDKKIENRKDLEEMFICVPVGDAWVNRGEAIGFIPNPTRAEDLYANLQSGFIQGQENTLANTMKYSLAEVTKSISMTNHKLDVCWLAIGEAMWQSFDEETKQAFIEGSRLAGEQCAAGCIDTDTELVRQFRSLGLSVYEDIDLTKMKEEVWEYYWSRDDLSGSWDKALYEKIRALEGQK